MSIKALTILVIISLAFNVAFLAVFVFHQFRSCPPFLRNHEKLEYFPRLREYMQKTREVITPLREEFEQFRQEFIDELSQKEISEENLRNNLERTLEKQMTMEKQLGERLIEIRLKLSPEEAELFFRMLPPEPYHEKILRRIQRFNMNK
ncbi:MAG: hypothetical protein JXB60_08385 [Candidatus Cloacimonetes bacterium]|nr:hypothetical protein [Candidatus Cloacimonadota bacterium]